MEQMLIFLQKARQVKLLAMDVDGVLTDGMITYDANGVESKSFHVQDGFGIKCLQAAGFKTAIITARKSPIVEKRAKELQIDFVVQGCEDKLMALQEILQSQQLTLDECAYIGDDWTDIAVLKAVGFGVAVLNANQEVLNHADMVGNVAGGQGAVRELCDLLLKAHGQYDVVLQKYLP